MSPRVASRYVLLLEGRDREDPLFLQIKQATRSVLADHLAPCPCKNQGRRLMQTVSDLFLGWDRAAEAEQE